MASLALYLQECHESWRSHADQDPHRIPTDRVPTTGPAPENCTEDRQGYTVIPHAISITGRPSPSVITESAARASIAWREEGDRWRAVWYEDGQRRQCESVSEGKLAVKLEKVTERLTADAPNMERSGAELVAHYLDPGRLPARAMVAQARPYPARQ
jgi:hypothetical protein